MACLQAPQVSEQILEFHAKEGKGKREFRCALLQFVFALHRGRTAHDGQ